MLLSLFLVRLPLKSFVSDPPLRRTPADLDRFTIYTETNGARVAAKDWVIMVFRFHDFSSRIPLVFTFRITVRAAIAVPAVKLNEIAKREAADALVDIRVRHCGVPSDRCATTQLPVPS
jgi:hypothetical protein